MKKFFATLTACVFALVLLVGCSKMGAITDAFTKEGYDINENEITDENSVIKSVVVVNKGFEIAIIVELGSTKDIDAAIEDLKDDPVYQGYFKKYGNDVKAIHEKLEELGLINKNVMFVGGTPAANEIFKNA